MKDHNEDQKDPFQASRIQKLACFGALDLDSENPTGFAGAKESDLILLAFKLSKQKSIYFVLEIQENC